MKLLAAGLIPQSLRVLMRDVLRRSLGRIRDPKFHDFETAIHPLTRKHHDQILEKAELLASRKEDIETDQAYKASEDPIVRQGYLLREECLSHFKQKLAHLKNIRVLVHVPDSRNSPGGFSLFSNLVNGLKFIGIEAECLKWNDSIIEHLTEFQPTVLLTSDSAEYLTKIDWAAIDAYRVHSTLKIGLTASLEGLGKPPLSGRLEWARKHGVDFYFCFQPAEWVKKNPGYAHFLDAGYKIFSVEFGANPLVYYPVPAIERDLDYVFLASSNSDKRTRYYKYLRKIFETRVGLIDGPGWKSVRQWAPPGTHRYLYARAKVGINLHVTESIDSPCELNERTYILAACGVPQLVDEAKLLPDRFSKDSIFVARDPLDYSRLMKIILAEPKLAQERALKAQQEVFDRHTSFHRAEFFALDLLSLF